MIRLGEKQDLTVVKTVDFGVYLASEEEKEEKVLLPRVVPIPHRDILYREDFWDLPKSIGLHFSFCQSCMFCSNDV